MADNWKIRLLGGVLQGREIWLTEGRLSIGERNCDLCLPLQGKYQLMLTVTDGGLFIDAGEQTVRVNGRKHKPETPLPETGIVQLPGLTMAFGHGDADLSVCRIPRRKPVIVFSCVMFLLLLLGAGLTVFLLRPDSVAVDMVPRIDALLQQNGLTQITVNQEQDGTFLLSGYCQKSAALQTVRLTLSSWSVLYHDQVICRDQLIRDVRDVLTQAGYNEMQITSPAPGEVHINADVSMDKRWAAVQKTLAGVSGLRHFTIDNPRKTRFNTLAEALLRDGLAENVSVTLVGQAFLISGILTEPQQQTLTALMEQLRQQYPDMELNYQNVAPSPEGWRHFPSPVVALIQGATGRSLILENGTCLRTGSHLPDGGVIMTLTDKAVTLRYPEALINNIFTF